METQKQRLDEDINGRFITVLSEPDDRLSCRDMEAHLFFSGANVSAGSNCTQYIAEIPRANVGPDFVPWLRHN
jgi:hypothetical protein